jgi:NitT/TauT family transport system substrate-binding protein
VFDSSSIPGEILDLMVVKSETLKANPNLGKALVGAWYETLTVMLGSDAAAEAAKSQMAAASGTDVAGFNSQLATTKLYATPAEALAITTSEEIVKNMDLVRNFSFAHGLLGEGATSVDAVGIQFPGGRTLGDASKVTMRFDDTYVKMAVDGTL